MVDESKGGRTGFFAGLLQDHARIEEQLQSLVHAADALSRSENDAAALATATDVVRFFDVEGARHEADEEATLFPRLRHDPEFKQILSALQFQHQMTNGTGRELAECVRSFGPGKGRTVRKLAFRFVDMHRGHAIAEERALFPLAEKKLAPEVLIEMEREVFARKSGAAKAGGAR